MGVINGAAIVMIAYLIRQGQGQSSARGICGIELHR